MKSALQAPAERTVAVLARAKGSGAALDDSHVLTASELVDGQFVGPRSGPLPGPQVSTRHPHTFDVDRHDAQGPADVLTLKTSPSMRHLPAHPPGFTKLRSSMFTVRTRLYVQVFALLPTSDGGWNRWEVQGVLVDRGLEAERQARGLGEVVLLATTTLPSNIDPFLGAPVFAADEDCLVGFVSLIVVNGGDPQLAVFPLQHEGGPTDTLDLLKSVGLDLEDCDITTDSMAAAGPR